MKKPLHSLSEFKKLISTILYFLENIFLAIFFKNQNAKGILSALYLNKLNSCSIIKTSTPESLPLHNFILPHFIYSDTMGTLDGRLMKLTIKEILSILVLMKKNAPRVVFEFGLLNGGSLYTFYLNTSENVLLYSLDLNIDNCNKLISEELSKSSRIKIINENSLNFDHSPYLDSVDFIFIDGGHDYNIVKNDTEKAFLMLRSNGIIIWDDYNQNFPGVFNYLNEIQKNGKSLIHIKDTSLVYFQKM